jgi:TusA-related sulfurtransferase
VHGTLDAVELADLVDACDVIIEARGTFCPEPVIRTQNRMAQMSLGEVAMVLADDAGLELDLPAWCMSTSNEYLGVLREENFLRAFVRRAAPRR